MGETWRHGTCVFACERGFVCVLLIESQLKCFSFLELRVNAVLLSILSDARVESGPTSVTAEKDRGGNICHILKHTQNQFLKCWLRHIRIA